MTPPDEGAGAPGTPQSPGTAEPANLTERADNAETRPETPETRETPEPETPEPETPEPETPEFPGVRQAIEAILLVVDEPVSEVTVAQVLERPRDEVLMTLNDLVGEYNAQGRGFELRQVAGGWRLYTRPECASIVERFVLDGQQARLTHAALETLAVVAYRQPVSRTRVSAVRGVNVDGVMRTLVIRGLVEEAGSDHETGAILYRTTSYFLERLGITSLEDLPELAPLLPEVEGPDAISDSPST